MVSKSIRVAVFGSTAFLILCALTVHGIVLTGLSDLEQNNQELVSDLTLNYTDHIEKLTKEIEDLESENADLRAQLQLPPAVSEALPQPPDNVSLEQATSVKALMVIDALLVIVLGCMSFLAAVAYSRSAKKEWETEAERIRKDAYQEGLADAPKKLIEDTDALSNLVRWLWLYKGGKARIDDAAIIQRELLMHLISVYRLMPVGEIGEAVYFDPERQRTYDRILAGEEVVIVEPGWRIGGRLVELPVVSRRSDDG